MHLNAFYDLQKHTYTDALIQPIHHKDEFRAFCDMVDRHIQLPGSRDVFIATGATALITTWHMSSKKDSTFFSVQKISIPKVL